MLRDFFYTFQKNHLTLLASYSVCIGGLYEEQDERAAFLPKKDPRRSMAVN